jgi:hypothetical protein
VYKASAGIVLPTSIIGSLPRPAWHTAQLGRRSFLEAMVNARWREQYEDAVSTHLRAQEVAGSTSAPTATRITTRKSAAGAGRATRSPIWQVSHKKWL